MEDKAARKKDKSKPPGHTSRKGKREGAAAKELSKELREAEVTFVF